MEPGFELQPALSALEDMNRFVRTMVASWLVANCNVAWSALTDDLVAYYRFEDNFADTSGSPQINNGTPVNFPGFTTGKLGRGMSLTGFRDYMSLDPAVHTELDFGSTADGTAVDFTIAMWIKQSNSASDPAVLSNKDWDSGANEGINWAVNGDSVPFDLNMKGDSGVRHDLDSAANSALLAVNSWNLVVMTVDRDGPTRLYINGVNTGTIPLSSQGDFNTGLPWNIGQDGVGNYGIDFTGAVDELAFWRRSLTGQEASQIWNGGVGTDLLAPQFDDTLKLVVNRQSGSMQIVNDTAVAQEIRAYSILSLGGALDPSAWTTVSNHYDGAGNGSVDNERWVVFSKSGSASDLSEGSLGVGSISQGAAVDLGTGIWKSYYKEDADVSFEFLDEIGQLVQGIVEFTGGPSGGFPYGDLNFDGSVTRLDWLALRARFGVDLANLSTAQRYRHADLDGDGQHSLADILEFQRAFDKVNGSGAFASVVNQLPEPQSSLLLFAASIALMSRKSGIARKLLSIGLCLVLASAHAQQSQAATLFSEDFDRIVLGPKVDEGLAGNQVWSGTPPTGWFVDDSNVPGGGVTEWAGWSFADPTWWAATAEDQGRSWFTKATGVIAIADPDEWDDLPHALGTYNTFLQTPPISLGGAAINSVQLRFDSSWLPEDFQTANLTVSYDGGIATEVFRWSSEVASPHFKPGATNETVIVPLQNPAGATNMVLRFGLFDAGNDWWWAIDNLQVFTPLTLQVNTATGAAVLLADPSLEISGYEIFSPGGSLSATDWLTGNLDHQDFDVPQFAADFNGDSLVDGQDLSVWSAAYASSGAADADDDGDSDGRDFLTWQRNLRSEAPGGDPWLTFLASDSRVIEATLGESAIVTNTSLGFAYNAAKDSRDLAFEYITRAGDKVTGSVVYVGGSSTIAVPEPMAGHLMVLLATQCLAVRVVRRGSLHTFLLKGSSYEAR